MPRGVHNSTVLVSSFVIFLSGCGVAARGDSTAAATTADFRLGFRQARSASPREARARRSALRERLERLFRKRASDAFRGSAPE